MLLHDRAVEDAHDLGEVLVEGVLAERFDIGELGQRDPGEVRVEAVAGVEFDDSLEGIVVVVLVDDATQHAPDVVYVLLLHSHHFVGGDVAEDGDGFHHLAQLVPLGDGLDLSVLVYGDVIEVLRDCDGLLHVSK